MQIRSVLKLGTVAALTTVALAACGTSSSQSQAKNQTLNWMESSALPTMDNSLATDVVSGETLNNTGEGLLKFGKNSSTHPGVAKSYTKSKDGKTYTFNLRKSNWSNGDKVTAKDFVYGWQRTVNPKTGSQYAYLYADVKNANAIMAGKKAVSTLGIKALGNYKVQVSLVHPVSYFPTLVAQTAFFPQNQRVVEKYGKKYATNAQNNVYNGAFKLTYWTGTSDNWTLTKNTKYWNAKSVKLKHIKFSAVKDPQTALSQYQSGKLDAIYLSGQQPKNYKNSKEYHARNSSRVAYLELNEKKDSMMRNVKARQALSLVLNRKQFVNQVLDNGSKVANGIVTAGLAVRDGKDFASEASIPAATEHNVAKAKKLWKQALKETGRKSYSLTLMADDTAEGKSTTEYVQSQWSKLPNFKVTNSNLPYKTRLARSAAGQFDAVVTLWGADFPDPITDLSLFTSGNSYNDGKWSNKTYDKLVKEATTTNANKPAARWQNLVDAQKVLLKDQGIIPIYQSGKPQLMKSKVKGIVYFPVSSNWDFSKAYISK
ncbi:MAG: peptide ABC transporter substrate-binding protein [Levilactobacillus sp.]|uniref:peptide ABC transporter substrate-binding protein n=1 Tax=Levilactobacillus sp. TaxID=2767919 RepID=UPI002583801D|nr:peptide ABC transporter substrate-binding protein [Levilactobacillus sp.]MCH4123685.1 peptide ABC transporter substrate-binding protein [Levilactobacillus sp.]MCI1553783.1 peptide ABC transporter substrate-binding protein [Levilactobacillus sp.]MCI1599803.1 peptide ABC transporter substrate-binding protein [Levilactobacillus sp.]MCI1605377.1 peptide ABC transporter substrate-binding protein [Levilactobacillus sp.]